MAVEDVDLVVIGMGPGGEAVAAEIASAGLSVVGVNSGLVGGECPYYACVPTKMMVRAAGALAEARRVRRLAGSAETHPDWTPVADRIRDEATSNWDDGPAVQRFEDAGGRFVRGSGRISAAGEVTVAAPGGQRVFAARRGIVLNPGTEPAIPPVDGLADTPYWTNREAVKVRDVPESLIVLGAGPVGVEFGQIFARFGTEVTMVETQQRLLSAFEPEASDCLAEVFASEGIVLRTGTTARRVEHDGRAFAVELANGERLSSAELLVATGRRTDLGALGVAEVGLPENGNTIAVDEWMRAADRVWAVGDVTGAGAFTHTSVYQAAIAANDILGRQGYAADYRAEPAVAFTDPEVAMVGVSEANARHRGLPVDTGLARIPESPRGWIHAAGNAGLLKLVADTEREVLIGATAAAPNGGEIIGMLQLAIHAEIPLSQLRRLIFAYPTFSRAIEAALEDLLA